MTDIDKLAREIAAQAYEASEMRKSFRDRKAGAIRAGFEDDTVEVLIARLGIFEGERRERDKVADWLMKLAGDAAETLRSLNGKQTLTIAQNEEWERLAQQYTNLSESVRSGLPAIRSAL